MSTEGMLPALRHSKRVHVPTVSRDRIARHGVNRADPNDQKRLTRNAKPQGPAPNDGDEPTLVTR